MLLQTQIIIKPISDRKPEELFLGLLGVSRRSFYTLALSMGADVQENWKGIEETKIFPALQDREVIDPCLKG